MATAAALAELGLALVRVVALMTGTMMLVAIIE